MERAEFPRMRARVICVICHERKVRCDLQVSRDKICSNCRRLNQPCVQRQGRRVRNQAARNRVSRGDFAGAANSGPAMASPRHSSSTVKQNHVDSKSFISSDSVLNEETPPNNPHPLSWHDWKSTEDQLQSRYIHLPNLPLDEPLRLALLDSFAAHMGHWYLFVNMSQLREAPPLLQKALLLAGSLVRRVDTVEDLHLPYALYQQSKEAIYSSGGGDSITLLIAITIAACWSLRPPSVISLDGPWHWAGIAMRLALQLGLHQERTYPCLQDPNECRLVWWHLVNSDVLQAACWGRPCLIQTRHQDVQLPVHSDQDSIQLQVFNQVTRLLLILRRVIEHNMSQLSDIVPALVDWHQSVPEPLKLQNANGCRNTYSRPVNEMFILYFGFLMLVLFQHDTTKSHHTTTPTTTTSVSPITIAASSCMIRLYEEIHLHEDSPRLGSFHGFFLMLAAIPQIFHRTQVPEKERLREQELELICMVLGALHVKYGGSNMVLQKISKLRAESTDLQESEQAAAVAPGSHLVILESLVADSNILFPVPANFSPNLDLLDGYMPGDESQRDSAMDFLAFENSLIDWSATGSLYAPDFSQSIVL